MKTELTANDLTNMLFRRHPTEAGWVVLTEVHDASGFNMKRRVDALAVDLWPSRGHAIVGYEVKVSRADLQRELEDPAKADAVGKFCHQWWLVVADKHLADGFTIPPTWGVLAPRGKGLHVVTPAPKLTPKPITMSFAAVLLKNCTKGWAPPHIHDALKVSVMNERAQIEERAMEKAKRDLAYQTRGLEEKVRQFEKASGVNISDEGPWTMGDIGLAVKAIREHNYALSNLASSALHADQYDRMSASLAEVARILREMGDPPPEPPPPEPRTLYEILGGDDEGP
jgi:hypothetical protein